MRQKSFLHYLRANSFRLTSGRHSGMVFLTLSAPTAEMLNNAREHLRYWPYVKAFKPVDETHMNVLVFIGKGIPEKDWDYYVFRSCELMNQCVKQYLALFVITSGGSLLWLCRYHRNEFLRPDNLLKPFCDFIDELNQ